MRSSMLGAAAAAVVATPILHATGSHAARRREEIERHNDDHSYEEWQRPGDARWDDLDGFVRGGALVAGLGGLVAAGGAALMRRGTFAARAAGASTALLGAAALTGSGSVTDRLAANGVSVGSAIVGLTRDQFRPERPDVQAARPSSTAPAIEGADRPTKREILDADLPLPGEPDEEIAQANARKAVEAINWSSGDIVLWLPGTYEHFLPERWATAVDSGLQRADSTVLVDYPADLDFERSVATGMRTLQLVLAEVADRGADTRRVFVGGFSQGGWVAGDLMGVPEIRRSVDRAVLFGHPGLAQRHAEGTDPKVLEVNDGADPVTAAVEDRDAVIGATKGLEHRDVYKHPIDAVKTMATSPSLASFMTVRVLDPVRWARVDPHEYSSSYADAVDWLDDAPIPEA